jgi:hypothetical protein
MGTRIIDDRLAVDRQGISERAQAAVTTVDLWIAQRASNGFPHPICAQRTGQSRRHWYWAEDIDQFLTRHQQAHQRTFTTVDRSGDPDDLLTAAQCARVLGYRSGSNLPAAFLEIADESETKPGVRPRRLWRRSTVWRYADHRGSRRGGGPRRGTRNRLSDRVIDTSGEPDELVGSAEAARVLGYAAHTSLPAELYDLADERQDKDSGRVWHRWRRATLWAYGERQTGSSS